MQRVSVPRQEEGEPFHQFFDLLMTHWKNIGLHENTGRNKAEMHPATKT